MVFPRVYMLYETIVTYKSQVKHMFYCSYISRYFLQIIYCQYSPSFQGRKRLSWFVM